jgi:ferredoxin-NADP reductase
MARAALPGRLTWQLGTVVELVRETERVRSIVLELPEWPGHEAGQHVDVRLTAEDGYQAQRSYSIASAPEDAMLVLTVERLEDGEVSSYLTDELRPGDELELRGPIGGYFVWDASDPGPVLLVAGGSGIVPFRAMLRHRRASHSEAPLRLLYSVRSQEEIIYSRELLDLASDDGVDIRYTLTRTSPPGWNGYSGRIDSRLIEEVSWPAGDEPLNLVCGPSGFVETAAGVLAEAGNPQRRVRTERFGPTG